MTEVGIVGYGVYIPTDIISTEKIIRVRNRNKEEYRKDPAKLEKLVDKVLNGLILKYKTVAGQTQDSTTMAATAAAYAVEMAGINPKLIKYVGVGSESKPYEVGTIARHAASMIGIGEDVFDADLEGACNSGMQGVNFIANAIEAGKADYGLAIGSDVAQAPIDDPLEWACGAGAAAFLLGKDNPIATIEDMQPYSAFTHDFWRRPGASVPSHFGRTTVSAYIQCTIGAIKNLLKSNPETKLLDFQHFAYHEPSGYMPNKTMKTIARMSTDPYTLEELVPEEDIRRRMSEGVDEKFISQRVRPYFNTVLHTGNTYAASSMITTAYILDGVNPKIGRKEDYTVTKPGDNILTVSYGSWSHAIATWWKVTDSIYDKLGKVPTVQDFFNRQQEIEFNEYEKMVYGKTITKLETAIRTAKRTRFPRFVAELELIGNENYLLAKCHSCHRIEFPVPSLGKCFDDKCKSSDLEIIELPKWGRVERFRKIPWIEIEKAKKIAFFGKRMEADLFYTAGFTYTESPLVDLIGEPEIGMELEAVPRVLFREGKIGPIDYGIAYMTPVTARQARRVVEQSKISLEETKMVAQV